MERYTALHMALTELALIHHDTLDLVKLVESASEPIQRAAVEALREARDDIEARTEMFKHWIEMERE